MNGETILQLVGYFSTLLVLVYFLMTSVVKLRLVNLVGSGIFVVFALLTKSYPTAIMNIGICAINIYFLIKLFRSKSLTTMLPIETDTAYYVVRYVGTEEDSYRDVMVKENLWNELTESISTAKEITIVDDMLQYANTDLVFQSNNTGSES